VIASGKSLTVMHRRVKNQRLAAVGYVWAFAALTCGCPKLRARLLSWRFVAGEAAA
jgi:hypothetical protein